MFLEIEVWLGVETQAENHSSGLILQAGRADIKSGVQLAEYLASMKSQAPSSVPCMSGTVVEAEAGDQKLKVIGSFQRLACAAWAPAP